MPICPTCGQQTGQSKPNGVVVLIILVVVAVLIYVAYTQSNGADQSLSRLRQNNARPVQRP